MANTTVRSLALSLVMIACALVPAQAQGPQCGERSKIITQLASKHKEQLSVMGLAKDGRLLEIWSAFGSKSFTVLYTWPNLRSCIVSAGTMIEFREPTEFLNRFEF